MGKVFTPMEVLVSVVRLSLALVISLGAFGGFTILTMMMMTMVILLTIAEWIEEKRRIDGSI